MKIDKEILRERFKEYNALYFGKRLRMPRFSTYNGGVDSFGQCFCYDDNRRDMLRLSSNVDWTEGTLKNVLVHEMIHLYLYHIVGYKRWRSHGKEFQKVRKMVRDTDGFVVDNTDVEFRFFRDVKKRKGIMSILLCSLQRLLRRQRISVR